jgi:hypothetical protein
MSYQQDKDDFEEMTKYLSTEARGCALDSLACVFHNHGYSLQGNTAANDTLWLARDLSNTLDFGRKFENAPADRQAELMKIAAVAIKALPGLAERISSRYVRISKALRLLERVSRRQTEKMQKKLRR